MVGRYGETLVVDWGLAKSVARPEGDYPEAPLTPASSGSLAETQPGTAVGTPAYMSPEQAEGRFDLLGPSSDVYSLGGKFYTLLTGRPPVVGKDMAEVIAEVQAGRFPRPREHARWLDPALEAICLKAMALKPSDRYKTPTALAKDIERWIADEPTEAYREPWTLLARRWTKKHRTAVTAAAVAMVVALVGSGAITAVQTRANGVIKQQRNRAEDREAQAIAAVKRFGDVIANDPTLKQTPDLEDLRNRLLNEPRAFFRALRERLQSDHEVAPNRWSDSPRPATNWAS